MQDQDEKDRGDQEEETKDTEKGEGIDAEEIARKIRHVNSLQGEKKRLQMQRRFAVRALIIGIFISGVILGSVYFLTTPELPEPPIFEKEFDPMAPADPTKAEPFVSEKKKMKAAQKRLALGEMQGIDDLLIIAEESPNSPQAPEALLTAGASLQFNANDIEGAIKVYSQFLNRYPAHRKNKVIRKRLIVILAENHRYNQASKQIEEFLEGDPSKEDQNFAAYYLKKIK